MAPSAEEYGPPAENDYNLEPNPEPTAAEHPLAKPETELQTVIDTRLGELPESDRREFKASFRLAEAAALGQAEESRAVTGQPAQLHDHAARTLEGMLRFPEVHFLNDYQIAANPNLSDPEFRRTAAADRVETSWRNLQRQLYSPENDLDQLSRHTQGTIAFSMKERLTAAGAVTLESIAAARAETNPDWAEFQDRVTDVSYDSYVLARELRKALDHMPNPGDPSSWTVSRGNEAFILGQDFDNMKNQALQDQMRHILQDLGDNTPETLEAVAEAAASRGHTDSHEYAKSWLADDIKELIEKAHGPTNNSFGMHARDALHFLAEWEERINQTNRRQGR